MLLKSAPAGRKSTVCGSLRCKKAASRPARSASFNVASTASLCAVQSEAEAQLPSTTISNGAVLVPVSFGFSNGPDKPTITLATKSIRSNSNHHGLRSVTVSSSFRPSSNVTPGKRRRIGAGGTARNRIQRTGRPIKALSNQGVVNASGRPNISGHRLPWRDKATKALVEPGRP